MKGTGWGANGGEWGGECGNVLLYDQKEIPSVRNSSFCVETALDRVSSSSVGNYEMKTAHAFRVDSLDKILFQKTASIKNDFQLKGQ
jgi:hypothetical protein